jgi:chromate transporter
VPRLVEVFVRFLRLGCSSFGGPIAHLGYFRREFVERAKWLDDAAFTEIVALCSVLPGPTSSQVGIVVGARRAGPFGGLLAWLAFTGPTAIVLIAFGIALRSLAAAGGNFTQSAGFGGMLEGFAAAAAAVVALALLQIGRNLIRTRIDAGIAVAALCIALAADRFAPSFQWLAIAAGGGLGATFVRRAPALPLHAPALAVSRRTASICGGAFVLLLVGLPIVAPAGGYLDLFATFFRAGSLVFGGGHVVLPFLQGLIGASVSERTFFAGYGVTQAMPGPLFAFSGFLGAASRPLGGVVAALVALTGIFLPSFLLIAAVMPLWKALRELPRANAALAGINASVVGLLAAVLIDPIATTLVRDPLGILLALAAFALLAWARLPAWIPVLLCGAAGFLVRAGNLAHLAHS